MAVVGRPFDFVLWVNMSGQEADAWKHLISISISYHPAAWFQ